MPLLNIQESFADHIFKAAEIDASLFANDESQITERIKIYQNNIIGSLTSAMLDTYPLIQKLTGEDFSRYLMRSYVKQNIPATPYLQFYGDELAEFIKSFEPAKDLAYLPDIARLEWAMNDAYYAKDDDPLLLEDLQNIDLNNIATMKLELRDSVNIIKSDWDIISIRDFCLEDGTQLTLNKTPTYAIVYRPELKVEILQLNQENFEFLKYLKEGDVLGDAITKILEKFSNFDFQEFLIQNLTHKTIGGLS